MNRLYVAATWVPRRETITVGALGPITFTRSWYSYVGSARRGRDARVARHMRAGKPLRWHADYLFSRHPATRAWLIDTGLTECQLAARLRVALGKAERSRGRKGAADAPMPSSGCAAGLPSAAPRPSSRGAAGLPTAVGFGAGDCGCPGHLVAVGRCSDLESLLRTLPRRVGTAVRAHKG